jgi:hypothetical protein
MQNGMDMRTREEAALESLIRHCTEQIDKLGTRQCKIPRRFRLPLSKALKAQRGQAQGRLQVIRVEAALTRNPLEYREVWFHVRKS